MLCAAAIIFGATLSAAAADLSDYHKRVEAARMDVIALRRLADEGESFASLKREKLKHIQDLIPPSEKLEWQGGSVETDNRWVLDEISTFFDESDPEKGETRLIAVEERLFALGQEVGELELLAQAQRTKDEDKQKLAEILRREEYQKPVEQKESLFQEWLTKILDWLAKFFPRPSISTPAASGLGSLKFVLQIVIFSIVIGLIGFVLFKFGPQLAARIGFKPKEKKRDRVILGENIRADESAADLFSEAEQMAREGRMRDAIRKGYIAVLCELSDRKLIGLARHKTNRDYLRDLRKQNVLFEKMTGLTGTYERNWYGLRPSEQDDWEDFRDRCRQTVSKV